MVYTHNEIVKNGFWNVYYIKTLKSFAYFNLLKFSTYWGLRSPLWHLPEALLEGVFLPLPSPCINRVMIFEDQYYISVWKLKVMQSYFTQVFLLLKHIGLTEILQDIQTHHLPRPKSKLFLPLPSYHVSKKLKHLDHFWETLRLVQFISWVLVHILNILTHLSNSAD